MQPHKPTVPIADTRRPSPITCTLCVGIFLLGCAPPQVPAEEEGDPQPMPDVPADLPSEPSEYVGVLHGDLNYSSPTQFWECDTAEVFEMAYNPWHHDVAWVGSCWGVYNRVRGRLDRGFDPPRLFIDETLEARWQEPSDCSFFSNPDYESCHIEDNPDSDTWYMCYPVNSGCGDGRCIPERFEATEVAGWKHHDCRDQLGEVPVGQACQYVDADLDDCADTLRCWNPAGDLSAPGVCVPYCDLEGQLGTPCEGTCVRCSSSDEWGLCMTDCSGDDCNVDAFC
jgi:hypothetical protein